MYCAGDITLKFLHRKRGKAAIETIDIIPRYGGKIIHDCWASYLSCLHYGHGLCGSHLLHELTFIFESNGYAGILVVFLVVFSRKMDSINSTIMNMLIMSALLSGGIFPSGQSCSKPVFNRLTSALTEVLSKLAIKVNTLYL